MLDLCNIVSAYEVVLCENSEEIITDWREIVNRMQRWLEIMLHPDGEISFFNDASMGISQLPNWPASILDYAERDQLVFLALQLRMRLSILRIVVTSGLNGKT